MSLLKFHGSLTDSDPQTQPVTILGQASHLSDHWDSLKVKLEPRVTETMFRMGISALPSSSNDVVPLWLNRAMLCALPSRCSRHNTPSRAHAVTKIIKNTVIGGNETFVILCERQDVLAVACAAGRSFSLFSRKSSSASAVQSTITIEFLLIGEGCDQALTDEDMTTIQLAVRGVRLAARLVDTPCAEMTTTDMIQEIRKIANELDIEPYIIRGTDLEAEGFGGLWNVGKAAVHPPALVVLSHKPDGGTCNIALVGKGIVFDTGGLCIKSRASMCAMKKDMAGAAGVLGAFLVAVKSGFSENLHAVFCLAENAVGPNALRPDDIIKLYSGRQVEINNTDAEGRLVLGDGVSYAQHNLKADTILTIATLTGAQGTATGKYHAALVCNNEDWERRTIEAGRNSGDMVHPLVYCPELHFNDLGSHFADMKNSGADKAQSSVAGLFIVSQLGWDWKGNWIHVDCASPATLTDTRASGYGVALLSVLFGQWSDSSLLRSVAPRETQSEERQENAKKRFKKDI